jgi:molybdopterin-guanine dinucleotide biosynthesis protein B
MASLIGLVGPQGPEQLKFLEKLFAELTRSGLRVGAMVTDADLDGQWPAGPPFVGVSKDRVLVPVPVENRVSPKLLAERFFPGLDLVLTTAHPHEPLMKIEVCPSGAQPQFEKDSGLRAVVSQGSPDTPKPVFTPEDIAGLAGFIKEQMLPQREPAKVRIFLDGKKLPIKEFVQDIVADTVRAMVGSLRGGDRPGRLEIFID